MATCSIGILGKNEHKTQKLAEALTRHFLNPQKNDKDSEIQLKYKIEVLPSEFDFLEELGSKSLKLDAVIVCACPEDRRITDLEEILTLAATPPALVIAPCRHGTGTNALLLRTPGIIPFAFGPGSFAAHSAAARAAGVGPLVYRSETIALDLDTPEDWGLGIGIWGIRDCESGIED